MKRNKLLRGSALLLSLLLIFGLCACTVDETGSASSEDISATSSLPSGTVSDENGRVTDGSITADEATGDFTVTTSDGAAPTISSETTASGGESAVYTITKAGTYSLTGALTGQVLVEAGEEDEVVLELNGVTLTCDWDSPIKVLSAGKVEISAKSGTENLIRDTRAVKTADDDSQGKGAIYAKADLKLKGSGVLVIEAGYYNGVHTTKDLTIQNLSLKVTAYNNAIKGNDSVTVKSGTVVAISTHGDGVKTENTDANKSGGTRGDITLLGGNITVYAAGDGFQAAHNFEMATGEEGATPTVAIFTGTYSGYTADDASTTSYKGVKVQNQLNVKAGSITIESYDDGLHADYGTAFDAGGTGEGTINVTGGVITMNVYAPTTKSQGGMGGMGGPGGWGGSFSGGGMQGPGGWGNQQTVSGADAIHADYQLNISGGTIVINSAYEGLEANVINVSGGSITVTATDDGVNACKGVTTPQVNVTGGFLDVTVSPSGDTDGIDSNGSYTQTGGLVITRGPNSQMAAALDADGTVSVKGGTLIVLGYGRVSTGGSVRSVSLSLHSAGEHTVTVDGVTYTFTNAYGYGKTAVYSDESVK